MFYFLLITCLVSPLYLTEGLEEVSSVRSADMPPAAAAIVVASIVVARGHHHTPCCRRFRRKSGREIAAGGKQPDLRLTEIKFIQALHHDAFAAKLDTFACGTLRRQQE